MKQTDSLHGEVCHVVKEAEIYWKPRQGRGGSGGVEQLAEEGGTDHRQGLGSRAVEALRLSC